MSHLFSLHLYCVYGTPAFFGRRYIDDGYLAFRYAAFLYQKQLFDKSFKSRYNDEPLIIDINVDVGGRYRGFQNPPDWDTNPFVLRQTDEVEALPTTKIFTLQLGICQSKAWLNQFKTEFGKKLREIDLQEPRSNIDFSFFVDGCYKKRVPVYVITVREDKVSFTHYLRYGVFISLDDARNAAEKLSRNLGFQVQILERTLTRKLIWKALFDESFVI